MKSIYATLATLFLCLTGMAQNKQQKDLQLLDVTGSAGNGFGSVSGSYVYNWQLGKKQKFLLGVGARFTNFFGSNEYYVTAPAKITSGSTGPAVLFNENIEANLDSLLVASPSMGAINITINLAYKVTPKFTAGINIDALGFSFGAEKKATYVNGTSLVQTTAKPTIFNALLISDNDLGTLNSELFATYQLRKKVSLKIGYQYLFTEYKTAIDVQTLPEPNDRFRLKTGSFAVGIRYLLN